VPDIDVETSVTLATREEGEMTKLTHAIILAYLVISGWAMWFGPQRARMPRPANPVRPMGFLRGVRLGGEDGLDTGVLDTQTPISRGTPREIATKEVHAYYGMEEKPPH
jgi:hypothetical protein